MDLNLALWTLTGLLAAALLAAGLFKLVLPRERVVEHGAWAEDFSAVQLKLIAILELLAVAGLLLPAALGVASWLVPVTAALVTVEMAVATSVHVRRRDPASAVAFSAALGFLAVVVAVGRGFDGVG